MILIPRSPLYKSQDGMSHCWLHGRGGDDQLEMSIVLTLIMVLDNIRPSRSHGIDEKVNAGVASVAKLHIH